MTRRRASAQRSIAEWAVRGSVVVASMLLGYASIVYTLGFSMKGGPAVAHGLAPMDGRITARLSQAVFTVKASPAERARAAGLARLALRQDPTAIRALVTAGLDAQLGADVSRARRLFAYARALSRRDLQTQLWAIEDAVARDDIAGALRQYDIALRTSRKAPDILFPVLASASGDPAIRSALIATLAAKPSWGASFIDYSVTNGPGPLANASLYRGLRQAGVPVTDEASAVTIGALVAGGMPDEAWAYYETLRPQSDRRMSRDPHFALETVYPTPFDWSPVNDGSISTSIQRDGRLGMFDFAAPAGSGGALLRQMQLLPPGAYRIEGQSTGIEQPIGSRPYWVLGCGDGQEIGRVEVPNSTQANGRFSGSFTVPAGCPVQILTLAARPSGGTGGVSGQINRVRLAPAR